MRRRHLGPYEGHAGGQSVGTGESTWIRRSVRLNRVAAFGLLIDTPVVDANGALPPEAFRVAVYDADLEGARTARSPR